ncbi:MAG: Permease YjgP/YjgQ family protein [Acetothermia bacterium 64_32]|nr:MAG: Permease YjgP/YjgQ family protein [Acetothermia bacterium 64_32]
MIWAVRGVDRYLWRELLPTFGVALAAFLVFIGLELVLSLSDTLFARGAGAGEMVRLVSLKLPYLLTLAIPAGVLLATFLVLARLVSGRELLAFQALGYPLRRLLVPFVAFGLVASLLSSVLFEFVVPPSEEAYRRRLLSLLYQGEVPTVSEQNVFFRGREGELYYVSSFQGNRALGIVVYDLEGKLFPKQGAFPALLTALEGSFSSQELVLGEGRLFRFTEDGGLEEVLRFDRLTLDVGLDVGQGLLSGKTPSEMSLRELASRIALLRETGLDPRELVVEFHSKLAIAAAALIFSLFGAPLAVLLGRRGRAAGAVAGFVLAAAAQGLFIWTRTLARRGFLPASLGGWLPHLLLGALGAFLLLGVDRLRLRGLGALLLSLALAGWGLGAPPPFSELQAQRLSIPADGSGLQGEGVWARMPGFELRAQALEATWDGEAWRAELKGAELKGKGFSLLTQALSLSFDQEGGLSSAVAQGFSGTSSFRGPEKGETLLFSGSWGEARFREGELSRVEAHSVSFTTCPCLEAAPYTVEAERLVLIPERWLQAEGVWVRAFGRSVGWLPVYAARLGKESVPLFPELGQEGGDWFLRWFMPFVLEEEAWGAVGLAWFPGTGRMEPSLQFLWEEGGLSLTQGEGELTAEGEGWQAELSWQEEGLAALFQGTLGRTSWWLAWDEVETEDSVYQRAPELSLTQGGIQWLGGELSLRLSGGRYIEQGTGGKTSFCLSWARSWRLSGLKASLPWRLSLDQYEKNQRVTAAVEPSLKLGGVTLSYLGKLQWGDSPFHFDQSSPESSLLISIDSEEGGLHQVLALSWDLTQASPPSGRWTLEKDGLSFTGEFSLPSTLEAISGKASLAWEGISLTLQGEGERDEDLLIRGKVNGSGWGFWGGARLSPWPLAPKRLAAGFAASLSEGWGLRLAGEYDFSSRGLVQLEAAVLYTFSGCLRAGLEFYLGGMRLTLEVPAFPQARASFSPLDEGLQLGG